MARFKLGKLPAVADARVPRFSLSTTNLPIPPPFSNWSAGVGTWGMLMNDSIGNCVWAAIGHAILQFSTYAGTPLVMTNNEVIEAYKTTGYIPSKPNTDQGSIVLGPGGAMQHWLSNGLVCGGVLNKVTAYMQITQKNPVEWMQAINLFGGVLVGFTMPMKIMDTMPFMWEDQIGSPIVGRHEVWMDSYFEIFSERIYEFISWGQRFRMTEKFLLANVDEVIAVYDPASLNALGVDARGIREVELLDSMRKFA